nr:LPXTG cell wall anchor domain-containing protein [Leucobacter edaphi]
MFAAYANCGPRPASINSLPDGVPIGDAATRGWSSTNGTCNNSDSAQTGSWGNNKSLDTWTYAKSDVSAETRYGGTAAFTLAKSADAQTVQVGDEIGYSFTVKNTGTAGLSNVVISDPLLGITDFVCAQDLAVGAETTCDAPVKHKATDADGAAGKVHNIATANATPGPGASAPEEQTATADVAVTVPVVLTPGFTLAKTADATTVEVGESISYSFTVKNTGETPLTNVTIDDPLLGVSDFVCAKDLAIGAEATCDAPSTYTATDADGVSGTVHNEATATATSPGTDAPPKQTATADVKVTVPAVLTPGISLTKAASATSVEVGEKISYSFTVKNTGETPLTNVTIDDPLLGVTDFVCAKDLAVGAEATCDAPSTYTTTKADYRAGSVTNHATASGTAPGGKVTAKASALVRVTEAGVVVPHPGTPTPDPKPKPTPKPGDDLPVTGGADVAGLALGAVALIAAGSLLLARRRGSRA